METPERDWWLLLGAIAVAAIIALILALAVSGTLHA